MLLLWTPAAALLSASVLYQAPVLLNHDVGLFLHGASRLLDGAALYRDVVEINPPGAFFLSLPPAAVARLTGLPAPAAMKAWVVLLVLLSGALCLHAARRTLTGVSPGVRACFLLALIALLLPAARDSFGQREHLLVILAMPYLVAAAGWGAGSPLDGRRALLVGGLAGCGVALKPHFLLLWASIELYLAATRGPASLWKRRENWGIALAGAAVALYLIVAAPDYFRRSLPLALGTYGLLNAPAVRLLLNPAALWTLGALVACYAVPPGPQLRFLRRVLAVGAVAVLAGAVVQRKGFDYHFYPAGALALLLITVVALDLAGRVEGMAWRVRRLFAAAAAALALLLAVQPRPPADSVVDTLLGVLNRPPAAETFVLFGLSEYPAFPTANYSPARWASRFSSVWFLPSLYAAGGRHGASSLYRRPPEMQPLERGLFEDLVTDFVRERPRVVMIDCNTAGIGGSGFDLVEYLSQDPRFAALWPSYQPVPVPHLHCMRIYRREG